MNDQHGSGDDLATGQGALDTDMRNRVETMLRVCTWPFFGLVALAGCFGLAWLVSTVPAVHRWYNMVFSDRFLFLVTLACEVVAALSVLAAWWVIFRTAWCARGFFRALLYLAMSVVLTPVLLLGLWAIPRLIQSDLIRLNILPSD